MIDDKNFIIMRWSKVPEGATILPTVWALRRKHDIRTREVKKWKAHLNIDGSNMVKGKHYDETYAPVATWASIRLILALKVINGWKSIQLDYVAAYPQAPMETAIGTVLQFSPEELSKIEKKSQDPNHGSW